MIYTKNRLISDFDLFINDFEMYKIMSRVPIIDFWDFFKECDSQEYSEESKNRRQKYSKFLLSFKNIKFDDDFISQWAKYRSELMLKTIILALYSEKEEYKNYIIDKHNYLKGKGGILFFPHYDTYMSIIFILASAGVNVTVLMDENYVAYWNKISPSLSYGKRVNLYGIQNINGIRKAINKVKNGSFLIMFPEFTLGSKPSIKTSFLNSEIYVPEGPVKIANKLNLPLLPLNLDYSKNKLFPTIQVNDNIMNKKESLEKISLNEMNIMKKIIFKDSTKWWSWQIFKDLMLIND